MIYILIVMWMGQSSSYSGKSALAVEFKSKEACMVAAKEIQSQQTMYAPIGTILCAKKE